MHPSAIAAHIKAVRHNVVVALTRYFSDLAFAEDCTQEACLRAIKVWARDGAPSRPDSWLIVVGRNAGIDILRKKASSHVSITSDLPEFRFTDEEESDKADMLTLLAMCCHPELKQPDQLVLALKIVCGFSNDAVAHALVLTPSAVEKRFTRAKQRASSSEVAAPELYLNRPQLHQRIDSVLKLIYLVFNAGYAIREKGIRHIDRTLCEEAIRLNQQTLEVIRGNPDAMGMLALMLFNISRFNARINADNELVKLSEQDRQQWDTSLINFGQVMLEKAQRRSRFSPYVLQAAIASVHCHAKTFSDTNWQELVSFYRLLYHAQPNPVIQLNLAVAVCHDQGSDAAKSLLSPLSAPLNGYLYFHTACAEIALLDGDREKALLHYQSASALTHNHLEKNHINKQIQILQKNIA